LHILNRGCGKMKKKITILGGGTGMSCLLKGLKDFPVDLTAVITVSDNGRSTGKLREEFHTPAVGDLRKVMTNLSSTSPVIKQLMEYRFQTSSDLNGHAVGNLILTALLDITGNLEESLKALSKLLDIEHQVLPISEDSALTLMGESETGEIIEGETQITASRKKLKRLFYKEEPNVTKEVITSIKNSDLIIFSMGSLYTSLLPNIICKEVLRALDHSSCPIMYLCNAMTQPGETDDFTVAGHVRLINHYLNKRKIDVVIAGNTKLDRKIIEKYQTEETKEPVIIDKDNVEMLDTELIEVDTLTVIDDVIRHDSLKLSSAIFSYLMRS